MTPYVSIIIPFKRANAELRQCLEHCGQLDFTGFEVILLPDLELNENFPGARVFATGPVNPSGKRNLGIKMAKGGILAFIDSDAYPAPDWLSKALPLFDDKRVAAVGGPNLTKHSDTLLERASGEVYASFACSGVLSARFGKGRGSGLEDLPSCNLLVRKSDLEENGLRFDEALLTAEDSKLCFELKALGKRLVFSREILVYHHRRKLFLPHLRQVWNYGKDKALLFKECFSRKSAYYLLPSAIVCCTASGIAAAAFDGPTCTLFSATMALYLLVVAVSSVRENWRHSPLVFAGIVLTHYTYGIAFLYGLSAEKAGPFTRRRDRSDLSQPPPPRAQVPLQEPLGLRRQSDLAAARKFFK